MPKRNGQDPSPNSPEPIPAESTDRLVGNMIAHARDVGNAGAAPPGEDPVVATIRQLADHLVARSGGGGGGGPKIVSAHPIAFGVLKYVVGALLALGAAYGGVKMAIAWNTERIANVEADVAAHKSKPAHDGSARASDVADLDKRVGTIERKVDEVGVKIDEKAEVQREQYQDIKEELRYLRRNRGD